MPEPAPAAAKKPQPVLRAAAERSRGAREVNGLLRMDLGAAALAATGPVRAGCPARVACPRVALKPQNLPSGSATKTSQATERFLRQLPDEFPYLAETARSILRSGFDFAHEFELGLDLLLEALEGWRGRE